MSDDKLEEQMVRCAQIARNWAEMKTRECQSPIEKIMLIALTHTQYCEWTSWHTGFGPFDDKHAVAVMAMSYVYVQFPVPTDGRVYRLDIAIVGKGGKFAIELDGHDFHERTKEQAAHDKKRDRALVAAGWKVLRFTGSEVWRDVAECADQVSDLVLSAEEAASA